MLKAEFSMGEERAYKVMITAHRRGVCLIAVYPRDVAEIWATRATDMAKKFGYPLMFKTESEE